ncbi:MAG TPA: serine hydrolase domain-containing protein [Acidimicrobiales bacterium]|nr:serine hydrolase domain-containing protein [Acidimicrobiales bacterium]
MDNPITGVCEDAAGTAARLASFPQLVGIQLAVVSDAAIEVAAAGVADADAPGSAVTSSTRFRPGSITKLVTATLVLQCVDDGLVELDEPVTRHVPSFRLRRGADADRVKVAHLIAHSSGIDAGDLFVDTGDGDDAVERYVDLLADVGLLYEPGRWMSYCNAGFVLAGHLVERVRDQPWEDVVTERMLGPLGMESTSFLTGEAEEARPAEGRARGHLAALGAIAAVPDGTLAADPMCTRGLGPAGATLSSTAGDLARLAASHLGVRREDVPPVLAATSAARMRELHARAPGGVTRMAGMGYAWQVWRGAGADVPLLPRIGGANPGQSGLIAVDPASRQAIVALTNSDQGVGALNLLLDGLGPLAVPDDEPPPEDLSAYVGSYASDLMTVDVEVGDAGGLVLRIGPIEHARVGAVLMSATFGVLTYPLTPVDRTTFSSTMGPVAFIDVDDDGRPQLLRWRMRALRRRSS